MFVGGQAAGSKTAVGRPAGCRSPSPQKTIRILVPVLALATVFTTAASLGVSPARAQLTSYVDKDGRRIYVNVEDDELAAVVTRSGITGARRLLEARRRALPGIEEHIQREAERHGVDPALVHAIIEVESAWNPRARSRKGALGLMQLVPDTAARFGVRDVFDPRQNVTGGVRYLRWLLDRFDNNLEMALAGYNAGENAVQRAGGIPPYRETRQYIARLQERYGKLAAGNGSAGTIFATVDPAGRLVYVNE